MKRYRIEKIIWEGNEKAGFVAHPYGVFPMAGMAPMGYAKNRLDAIGDLVERIEKSEDWMLSDWVSLIETKFGK